jgi:hypothetical protein
MKTLLIIAVCTIVLVLAAGELVHIVAQFVAPVAAQLAGVL